jgi:hypothetical protein
MPTELRAATRTARKVHHCGMCGGMIKVGERHHVYTNVYDGRVYDFRTCEPCREDSIVNEVHAWAYYPDEGVTVEDAEEWAHEARNAGTGPQIRMAEDLLRRNGCACERCEQPAPPSAAIAARKEDDQ